MPTGVNCPMCGSPMDTALMVHFADQKNGCTFVEVHYMCQEHEDMPFKVIRYELAEVKSTVFQMDRTIGKMAGDDTIFHDPDMCETTVAIPTHHIMEVVRSQLAQSGIATAIAAASVDELSREQQRRMCESDGQYIVEEPTVAKPIKRDDHNYIA